MPEECMFCRIAGGEIPVELRYNDDMFAAFHDIHPVAPVHILIVPKKHIADMLCIEDVDADLLGRVFTIASQLAREEGIAESGFRLVVNTGPGAGQTVPHLHFHLLGGRPMAWPPG